MVEMAARANDSAPGKRRGPKRRPGEPAGRDEVTAAVLSSATSLFAREGVEPVTLRDIAADAGVHPSLIGRYIGPRAVLIEEVYRHVAGALVEEIEAAPLKPRSFERDSIMGAWTVLMTYFALRNLRAPTGAANPVDALAAAIEEHYGLGPAAANWRATQIVGSALGWRLYEPLLADLGSIAPRQLPDLRRDLNLLHNIGASLDLPTVDPRPASER